MDKELDDPCIHHFFTNLPFPDAHWILISLVKLPNRKPFLFMLDSLNAGIDHRRSDVLAFLYNKFIRS